MLSGEKLYCLDETKAQLFGHNKKNNVLKVQCWCCQVLKLRKSVLAAKHHALWLDLPVASGWIAHSGQDEAGLPPNISALPQINKTRWFKLGHNLMFQQDNDQHLQY
ncbi:hypothetical protein ILYODFUR_038146 [Ilyodon furcidens]|uniref:Uncharacterized protein n=1 Tax=Ilyodon furcidens TaxID=33524 RepID=A0ABV0UYP8_9TELE